MYQLTNEIWIILVVAGMAAGMLNAIAGGGSFFSFTALLAAGLPPVTANATNALAMVPGYASSAAAYRREIAQERKHLFVPGLATATGGFLGAVLLVNLGDATFAGLVPWLLLVATVMYAVGPALTRRSVNRNVDPRKARTRRLGSTFALMLLSIYGGFFGAGMGIVLLAALAMSQPGGFHTINAAKHVHSILIQFTAVVIFVGQGLISWPHALVVTVATIAGGWLGIVVAKAVSERLIRIIVLASATAMTTWFFWQQYFPANTL